jgi:hypothetical protein
MLQAGNTSTDLGGRVEFRLLRCDPVAEAEKLARCLGQKVGGELELFLRLAEGLIKARGGNFSRWII